MLTVSLLRSLLSLMSVGSWPDWSIITPWLMRWTSHQSASSVVSVVNGTGSRSLIVVCGWGSSWLTNSREVRILADCWRLLRRLRWDSLHRLGLPLFQLDVCGWSSAHLFVSYVLLTLLVLVNGQMGSSNGTTLSLIVHRLSSWSWLLILIVLTVASIAVLIRLHLIVVSHHLRAVWLAHHLRSSALTDLGLVFVCVFEELKSVTDLRLVKAVWISGWLSRSRNCLLRRSSRALIARIVASLRLVKSSLLVIVWLNAARLAYLRNVSSATLSRTSIIRIITVSC